MSDMASAYAVTRISPSEAHAKMKDEAYTYIDVRSSLELASGRPAGAVNVPLTNDEDAFVDAVERSFAKDAKLIIGCQTGIRSLRAARLLLAAGFTNVLEQRAGFDAARGPFGEVKEPGWSRAGLPVEID